MTDPLNDTLTRRVMIRRLAALGAVPLGTSLLAACGGDDDSGSQAATTGQVSAADAQKRLAAASDTVRTLLWDGYADPGAYSLPSGVTVKSATMNADEDPIAKKGSYDISVGVDGVYPTFRQIDLAQPLDSDLLPNLSGLLDSDVMFKPGTKFAEYTLDGDTPYGMPFAWGVLSATYDSTKVKSPPESLEDFLDPKYKGKLGLGDDGPRVIGMVARSLGVGGTDVLGRSPAPYLLTSEDLDTVMKKIEEIAGQTQRLVANPYGEFASAYGRGEIIAAFPDWPPTTATAQDNGLPVEMAFVNGAIAFMDNFFIAQKVEASDAMYAFLNEAISEQTQYDIGKALAAVPVNKKAFERLVKEGPAWAPYADVDAVLESAPTAQTPPAESDEYTTLPEWLKRWEQFKTSF
jgi:spermidine/putrescine-binding protein